jgi:hypothetical protein
LLCRNFQQSKHLTHALGTLCFTPEFPAIEKLALLVHKLCRTQILCGKHWKKRFQYPTAEPSAAKEKHSQEAVLKFALICVQFLRLIAHAIQKRSQLS